MRLFILGATGRLGQLLVRFALERGDEVTAFVRSPEKMALRDSGLTVVGGDLLAPDQLARALPGHDAVISAFGSGVLGKSTVNEDFGRSIVDAMDGSNVRRLLIVSTGLLFRGNILARVLANTIFRNVVVDAANMEQHVVESDLQWTIARPPRLNNRAAIGLVRVTERRLPPRGLSATRADVAHFLLREAQENAHVGQIVGVAN